MNPVIKYPEYRQPDMGTLNYSDGKCEGWNECIHEIKKLNPPSDEPGFQFSPVYLQWVKWRNINHPNAQPITNSQHRFVEWALREENAKMIASIGDMYTMFSQVRQYLKDGNRV